MRSCPDTDIDPILLWQPSQNVPAAGNFATYNKISSSYFPLKFIHLTTNTRSLPVPTPANPAILPTTQRHFEWAALANARHFYSSIEYPLGRKGLNLCIPTSNNPLGRFHMTSQWPCWCSKTKKLQPLWCTKLILWESNSFFPPNKFCN